MIPEDISNSWVIDQGYFRNKDLIIKIKSSAENEFYIVTEDALIEMFKSDKWEKVSTNSLSIIKDFKEKILVTNPIGLIREKEIETKKAYHNFVDPISTKLFWDLLDEIKNGMVGKISKEFQQNILRTQQYKSKKVLDHEKNKRLYLQIVTQFQEQMGPTLRNDLRKNQVKIEDIYQLILEGVEECFRYPNGAFNRMNEAELEYLISCKPVHYFLYATLLYEAFYWQQKLGLSQMNSKKITNYILDTNYVIIAIYSKGILSEDGFVNELIHHLKVIANLKFENKEI
jgi:hypothetical protein